MANETGLTYEKLLEAKKLLDEAQPILVKMFFKDEESVDSFLKFYNVHNTSMSLTTKKNGLSAAYGGTPVFFNPQQEKNTLVLEYDNGAFEEVDYGED